MALAEIAQIDHAELIAGCSSERLPHSADQDTELPVDKTGDDIRLRRATLFTTDACVLPGREALDRAAEAGSDALAWS